jgi:hypothetical protein
MQHFIQCDTNIPSYIIIQHSHTRLSIIVCCQSVLHVSNENRIDMLLVLILLRILKYMNRLCYGVYSRYLMIADQWHQ